MFTQGGGSRLLFFLLHLFHSITFPSVSLSLSLALSPPLFRVDVARRPHLHFGGVEFETEAKYTGVFFFISSAATKEREKESRSKEGEKDE